MKNILKLSVALAGLAALSPAAKATDLLNDVGDTVSSTKFDDMRLGHINPSTTNLQSWIGSETLYPGATTTGTNFSRVFTFSAAQLGDGAYVEISGYDASPYDYMSAWTGSYNPTATAGTAANPTGGNSNFLGDNLGPGNFAGGTDGQTFQVTVPKGGNLIVVVTDYSATGAAELFNLTVQSYSDTQYTDSIPGAVPEPATWAMLGAGALVGGVTVLRRRRATV